MFEEATLCIARQSSHDGIGVMVEQMGKEPLEMTGGSGSFTALAPAKSLCVVDHLPPTEDI
jgi:hypothetical protein